MSSTRRAAPLIVGIGGTMREISFDRSSAAHGAGRAERRGPREVFSGPALARLPTIRRRARAQRRAAASGQMAGGGRADRGEPRISRRHLGWCERFDLLEDLRDDERDLTGARSGAS